MNEKALKTLEYNKIVQTLTNLASSPMGKERCKQLLPYGTIEDVRHAQQETSDALSRLIKDSRISFSGMTEIRPSLMRLSVGSSLSIPELLQISSILDVALRVKTYGRTDAEESIGDSLEERFTLLEPLTPFNNKLKICIVSEEELSDEASSTLKSIRRSIRIIGDRIHSQLNSIVNSSSSRTMLQDNIITMRDGRYCMPVKAEYRGQFDGMVHDQSSSGSTIFIEPAVVVKLNNDLRAEEIKEKAEIERILAELSAEAALEIDNLRADLDILTELDFIFAKAMLSKQWKCSEPIFNQNRYINIKKGRHPLIDPKKVVPIDIFLGKDFDLLIITGPNTGGKTVSLKTVGLFTLMGQAGLHIPAFDQSELAFFHEVYADIGDEQSIEQSLSTFSSHMTNTVSILSHADENSFVLFDELGSGTDPTEGAALAMSILSYLHSRGIRTMATTHYSEIKIFALSTDGIENACCEFDVATLRPTYRLLIGIPGKSNAFAISGKLGLPEFIIEDAKMRIDVQDQHFEDLVTNLEESRNAVEQEHEKLKESQAEIEQLKEKLRQKNERLDSAKERIISKANEEAREILQNAKDYADTTIRNYNKWSTSSDFLKNMEQERNALREKLDKTAGKTSIGQKREPDKKYKPKDFKLGDSVSVLTLGLTGTVSSLPNAKGDLYVQMGILRSLVNIKDLEPIAEETVTGPGLQKTGSGKIKMSKSATIHPEINLIGKNTAEAIPLLDKYLDDAYLSHLPQVTVIHGRGTGALKNAVHQLLKKSNYVKSFRVGEFGEGDHGVTIVTFK